MAKRKKEPELDWAGYRVGAGARLRWCALIGEFSWEQSLATVCGTRIDDPQAGAIYETLSGMCRGQFDVCGNCKQLLPKRK